MAHNPNHHPQDFVLPDAEYTLFKLRPEHTAALQELFEACADFNMLVEGREVPPTEAEELFQEAPPGRSLDDKFLYGIKDRRGTLTGLLEGYVNYPDVGDWWIGLMLLKPEARGQGLGVRIVERFAEYVGSKGGRAIMLGVVEDNRRAYSFWESVGFSFVRQTDPRCFGKKMQRVLVMRRKLIVSSKQ